MHGIQMQPYQIRSVHMVHDRQQTEAAHYVPVQPPGYGSLVYYIILYAFPS